MSRLVAYSRFIVVGTLAIELAGVLLLYPLWEAPTGAALDGRERLWLSVFHSVSAFCNAGFDITGASMVPYRYTALAHLVLVPLIVIGGLGFPVLSNLATVAVHRLRRRLTPAHRRRPVDLRASRLNLHTKIVLVTSLCLYLFGFVAVAGGQLAHYVRHANVQTPAIEGASPQAFPGPLTAGRLGRTLLDASFMSVTARTAGFNSMPMEEIEATGRYALTSLMLVGGSPGSTAGGVKTTVVAVLVLSVVATIRQRRETEAFGRTIADALVRRAGTIGICYIGLIGLSVLLLTLSEPAPFEIVLFECVSAATTTGLSLGLTPDLSPFGKGVIIATMFLGRVGPLALLGALIVEAGTRRPYGYAHENVALG